MLLVEREDKQGRAVAALDGLHKRLVADLAQAEREGDSEMTKRLRDDIQYLEGYQQAPAAALADLCAVTPRTPRAEVERRKQRFEEVMRLRLGEDDQLLLPF